MGIPKSLDEVEVDYVLPVLLKSTDSALVCFAAGFYGKNDAYWMALAGMTDVTLIDIDAEKMEVMQNIYPKEWTYLTMDFFDYEWNDKIWDFITCDCPLSMLSLMWESRGFFQERVNKAVVMNVANRTLRKHKIEVVPRSSEVAWAVITNA